MRLSTWFRMAGVSLLLVSISKSNGDVVEAWNNALLDSFRTENTHPCVAARALAIVHGAMYDASAILSKQEPFYASARAEADWPVTPALNCAAFTTATNLFPSRAAAFRKIYSRVLLETDEDPKRPEAIRFGRTIGDAWISWRASDGSSGALTYVPSKEPGAWRRTPPFVRPPEMQSWARVIPFALVSAAQFRPAGPPRLSSEGYASDVNSVKELGGAKSSKRTAEQTEIARFWSDFSYTVTPAGHWNQVAQAVARARKMPLIEKTRMFAVLNITMSDVSAACWDSKYVFNLWRPVTAIRNADKDGNPATEPDATWMPLLNTPAFPEYVSGHSAFSGAGAVILASFNGGDEIEFSVPSDTLPGKVRTYRSLWKCAVEVSQSRLYGGIHFSSALMDGLEMGRNIAAYILEHQFPAEAPANSKLIAARGELDRTTWMGLVTRPGRAITIERLAAPGEWTPWTNTIAATPVFRWPLDDLSLAPAFRVKSP